MTTATIILIAIALAVDAFAVALATGTGLRRVSFRHTFRLAWHFGFFQAGMNIIGWTAGLSIKTLIESADHWIAFGLLFFVGAKMIIEALAEHEERRKSDPTRGRSLIMLSVATSIDALAVGLSFAVLGISVWFPALVIGVVAALLTTAGLHLGNLMGRASRLGNKVEIFGGIVLIGLGLHILHEHGVF